jgi:hypothetical protein
MTQPIPGLDHDQVEPEGESRDRRAVGQRPSIEKTVRGGTDPYALAVVDRLLGKAERALGSPPDLDHDERRGWTRIDRHQVDLVPTDVDVPCQDRPAGRGQPLRDQ